MVVAIIVNNNNISIDVPWFPKSAAELDSHAKTTLQFGQELSSEYPGANDPVYRSRREEIIAKASTYTSGNPLPRIEYTSGEKETWRALYTRMKDMQAKYACREYIRGFALLEEHCGFSPNDIPQLEDISQFLVAHTGFLLRPVMGLLTSRDFLYSLAFRIFSSTQYVRHHSDIFFTPEPDCCHDILGHMPMLLDPDFAQLAQDIGLASLGASDEDIERLANIYWYTVEFGLCKEGEEVRAYGAGLLSSYGELQNAFSDVSEKRPFNPLEAATLEHSIVDINQIYYIAESFNDATDRLKEFALKINRPFSLTFSPKQRVVDVAMNN